MDEARTSSLPAPVVHWLTFFSQWLRSPLRTASMVPSGRQLAAAMAAALPADARQVIELGPGTGAITEALLDHQPAIPHMLLVEMNAVLVELLQNRYPDLPTVCADARQLDAVVAATPGFESGQVDAVVSSLGLLAMPEPLQHDILAAAFAALKPGGVFIQYTYGFAHPVADAVCSRLGLICISGRTAWLNLPPARVFIYRRV